jgi:DNA (cytosine-5)-methyltransferase 1
MKDKLKVLDLFSGIGGFSLGLERTGGFETVAFCEIEEFPRRVLAKHWPEVPRYNDIRELTADTLGRDGITKIDVIVGGFPCQDISSSGRGAGLAGERSGLWSEYTRLIGEIRPSFVIVENSPNLLSGENGEWFSQILGSLAQIGYDAEWECISAEAVGAPHKRERVWIIAYPSSIRQSKPWGYINAINPAPEAHREADTLVTHVQRGPVPFVCERHDGVPTRVVQSGLKGFGNAVDPVIVENLGRAILDTTPQTS